MVIRRSAAAIGLAALLALAPDLAFAAQPAIDKAVWVWEADSAALLQSRAKADEVIRFAKAQQVTTLHVYADRFAGRSLLTSQPAQWRRLLRRLHREGFKVEALLGSAFLHTEQYVIPARREIALDMFRRVIQFNAASPATEEHFDGIHFDIEPHLLPNWDDERDNLLLAYLELGRAIVDLRHTSGTEIPIAPDIPFWLDSIVLEWEGNTRSVAEHLIRLFDSVTLMDYRNVARGSDGIIAHATLEMDIAERAGRRVVVGVETGDGELAKTSFASLQPVDLERELALTAAAFQGSPAFGGFAIHHYGSWKAWLEKSAARAADTSP